jgi:hypothetical protein
MLTYTSCATLFDKARSPEAGKPIGANTRIMRRDDCYALRFHATDILTFMPSGAVRYDTGEWRTVTTKVRMNKYGPACVYSDRGIWHIKPRTPGPTWTGGAPYVDGCIVHRGKVKGAGKARDVTRERKLRASLGKFARDYVAKLYAGEIAAPNGGECWGCLMRADDGVEGDRADLPFARPIRDMLVETGRAEPHHRTPESSRVVKPIRTDEDADEAIELFRLGYERARVLRAARVTRKR